MSVNSGQPEIRFNAAGPMGLQGVSYAMKNIFIRKTVTTVAETDTFMQIPAGAFIVSAAAVCTNACDANTTVTLGTDGDPDALVNATNFSVETVNNLYVFRTGYYFATADNLVVEVAGATPAAGEVEFVISYFELAEMETRGIHFDL